MLERMVSKMEKSEQVNELVKALCKAQEQFVNPSKNQVNPFHKNKYADLTAIIDTVRKPLASNGLAFIQTPEMDGELVNLTTTLFHTSGQYISFCFKAKAEKNGIQGIGSLITYAKRYSLTSLLGIAPEGDDDDGEATKQEVKQQPQQKQQPQNNGNNKPSKEQMGKLHAIIKELGIEREAGLGIMTDVCERKINSSKELNKYEISKVIDFLEHQLKAKEKTNV